ncbi:hypothetical protein D3C71_1608190 [compost metagenome]
MGNLRDVQLVDVTAWTGGNVTPAVEITDGKVRGGMRHAGTSHTKLHRHQQRQQFTDENHVISFGRQGRPETASGGNIKPGSMGPGCV